MLSARGVKIEMINELIAEGLATIEITRVKITEAGRRTLYEARTEANHLARRARSSLTNDDDVIPIARPPRRNSRSPWR
jgi:hypothetical protein